MQKLNKDITSYMIEFIDCFTHVEILDKLHPGSYEQYSKKTYKVIQRFDRKEYYVNGKLHRYHDLPAIEWIRGSKEWYQNGKLHRENDLPAQEFRDGAKFWYKDGKKHRNFFLPAIVWANKRAEFWLDGIKINFAEITYHPKIYS